MPLVFRCAVPCESAPGVPDAVCSRPSPRAPQAPQLPAELEAKLTLMFEKMDVDKVSSLRENAA